jgi:serine/threonine protein kinase
MKRRASLQSSSEDVIKLGRMIGSGVYGRVYQSMIQGRQYAVKYLLQERDYESYMPSILREILIGGSVCKLRKGVAEFSTATKDYATISTEGFCTLGALAPQFIPLHAVRVIGYLILKEIHELHQQGIMHRDIKPENILIMDDAWPPTVRIIDYGISTVQERSNETAVVSLWWRAPEILYGFSHDNKIDVWAFGAIIAGLCCTAPLVNSSSEEEVKQMLWKKIGYPDYQMWEELHNVHGVIENREERQSHGLLYKEASEIIAYALIANPLFRHSTQQLLDNSFWVAEPTKDEADKCSAWFQKRIQQIKAYKNRAVQPLETTKEFHLCYPLGSSHLESDALYTHNSLCGVTVNHATLLKECVARLEWSSHLMEQALFIIDRALSSASVFPPWDAKSIVAASLFIAACIFSDRVPSLSRLKRYTGCTTNNAIMHSVHFLMCSMRCRLIPTEIKKFIRGSPKWEKLVA